MAVARAAHEHWSSRFAFLMAAIGSSVGLGNFWRFPFTAGENGGAIFVLVYIVCIVCVAFPVLVAEYAIGRRAQTSAVGSARALVKEAGTAPAWEAFGWVGMIGAFLILSFYSVVAGWVLLYIVKAFTGAFVGLSADAIADTFSHTIGADNRVQVILAHTAFMGLTAAIVARGVTKGIEVAVQILMPLFFVMLLGVVLFGLVAGDAGAAAAYLFKPEPCVLFDVVGEASAANACGAPSGAATRFSLGNLGGIFSAALGQAFFSVGVGVGLMITYGSYIRKDEKLLGSATIVAASDTFVALIAGMAIFPIVFGFGLDPNGGPGLFFVTLPVAFSQLPVAVGILFGGVFFTLALFAALTSSISLLEVSASWAKETVGLGRFASALGLGGLCWLVGLGSVFSAEFFDLIDQITEKLFLPIGGFLVALFAGWAVNRALFRDEMHATSDRVFAFWRFLIRWVAPIGTIFILYFSLSALITNPPAVIAAALSGG